MPQFQLTIELTAADTKDVNEAGQQIALVKETSIHSSPSVIWISFSPFESNTVTWRDEYGLFASPDKVSPKGFIEPSSRQLPAKPETVYPFENGVFGPSEGTMPPNQYATLNREPRTLTFGLVQTVAGGGKNLVGSPVNAIVMSGQMKAVFEPNETIFVFLQKELETGSVNIVDRSDALKIPFSNTNRDQTIHYDSKEGRFIPGPLS